MDWGTVGLLHRCVSGLSVALKSRHHFVMHINLALMVMTFALDPWCGTSICQLKLW